MQDRLRNGTNHRGSLATFLSDMIVWLSLVPPEGKRGGKRRSIHRRPPRDHLINGGSLSGKRQSHYLFGETGRPERGGGRHGWSHPRRVSRSTGGRAWAAGAAGRAQPVRHGAHYRSPATVACPHGAPSVGKAALERPPARANRQATGPREPPPV